MAGALHQLVLVAAGNVFIENLFVRPDVIILIAAAPIDPGFQIRLDCYEPPRAGLAVLASEVDVVAIQLHIGPCQPINLSRAKPRK